MAYDSGYPLVVLEQRWEGGTGRDCCCDSRGCVCEHGRWGRMSQDKQREKEFARTAGIFILSWDMFYLNIFLRFIFLNCVCVCMGVCM